MDNGITDEQLAKVKVLAEQVEGYTDDATWVIDLDEVSTTYDLWEFADQYEIDWTDDDNIKLNLRRALIDVLVRMSNGINYEIDEQKARLKGESNG